MISGCSKAKFFLGEHPPDPPDKILNAALPASSGGHQYKVREKQIGLCDQVLHVLAIVDAEVIRAILFADHHNGIGLKTTQQLYYPALLHLTELLCNLLSNDKWHLGWLLHSRGVSCVDVYLEKVCVTTV